VPVLLRAFSDITSQTQTVQLGDASYRVRLIWRERTFAWYMSISTVEDEPILTGVRVEPQQALMRFADPALFPDGTLITVRAGILGDAGTKSEVTVRFLYLFGGSVSVPAGTIIRDNATDRMWEVTRGGHTGTGAPSFADVPCSPFDVGPVVITTPASFSLISILAFNPLSIGSIGDAGDGTHRPEVVQADLASDLLITFYTADEIPDATADEDAPTITVP